MNSERRLFNLTGQVGTLQWNLDNTDTKKTCHSVRIIRMSVFLKASRIECCIDIYTKTDKEEEV